MNRIGGYEYWGASGGAYAGHCDPALMEDRPCPRCGGTGERLLVDEWIRPEGGGGARHRVWVTCGCGRKE